MLFFHTHFLHLMQFPANNLVRVYYWVHLCLGSGLDRVLNWVGSKWTSPCIKFLARPILKLEFKMWHKQTLDSHWSDFVVWLGAATQANYWFRENRRLSIFLFLSATGRNIYLFASRRLISPSIFLISQLPNSNFQTHQLQISVWSDHGDSLGIDHLRYGVSVPLSVVFRSQNNGPL